MSKYAEIKSLIRQIVAEDLGSQRLIPVRGTVAAIEGETCKVRLASGLEISDIRLKSVVTGDADYLLATPALGSGVLIFEDTIIALDKASSFELRQNGLKVLMDGNDQKVQIANNEVNLLAAILELTGILKNNYNLFTANGPTTGTLPVSKQAITQTENKLKKLLK